MGSLRHGPTVRGRMNDYHSDLRRLPLHKTALRHTLPKANSTLVTRQQVALPIPPAPYQFKMTRRAQAIRHPRFNSNNRHSHKVKIGLRVLPAPSSNRVVPSLIFLQTRVVQSIHNTRQIQDPSDRFLSCILFRTAVCCWFWESRWIILMLASCIPSTRSYA
jgi:hypothetical protein